MTEYNVYVTFLAIIFISMPFELFFLLKKTAPYGRHTKPGWGPTVPNWLGWVWMEAPSVFVMLYFFVIHPQQSVAYIFLVIWEIHYCYRTFIFPFRLRDYYKPMPIIIPFSGFIYNCLNASVNGYSLTVLYTYDASWLHDPRFIIGMIIFVLGYAINQHSDYILLNLRPKHSEDYTIPNRGLFRWISCPNYLGEILEWSGWAIATWSLAGLAFALWTTCTLLPRALSHHRWYKEKFPNYPKNRYAIIYKIM